MDPGNAPPRILIVGSGVPRLEIATELGRQARRATPKGRRFSVTLLDADTAHVCKPMLHTIAAGTRDVPQQSKAGWPSWGMPGCTAPTRSASTVSGRVG